MKHPKYIIVKTGEDEYEFRFGYVEYHIDLLEDKSEIKDCMGGGMYSFKNDKKILLLFGGSSDFGVPSEEVYRKAKIKQDYYYDFLAAINKRLNYIEEGEDNDIRNYKIVSEHYDRELLYPSVK